jgi:hypothetical protein
MIFFLKTFKILIDQFLMQKDLSKHPCSRVENLFCEIKTFEQ